MCEYNPITDACNCPNEKCPRHGKCCECIAFHREKRNKLPFCVRNGCLITISATAIFR